MYVEDETRDTHQAIHESDDVHSMKETLDEKRQRAYFCIEVKRCLPSMQTRRSVPSDDCDTAVHDGG
jgi:indole-3-glycerol phosphate synthase